VDILFYDWLFLLFDFFFFTYFKPSFFGSAFYTLHSLDRHDDTPTAAVLFFIVQTGFGALRLEIRTRV